MTDHRVVRTEAVRYRFVGANEDLLNCDVGESRFFESVQKVADLVCRRYKGDKETAGAECSAGLFQKDPGSSQVQDQGVNICLVESVQNRGCVQIHMLQESHLLQIAARNPNVIFPDLVGIDTSSRGDRPSQRNRESPAARSCFDHAAARPQIQPAHDHSRVFWKNYLRVPLDPRHPVVQ